MNLFKLGLGLGLGLRLRLGLGLSSALFLSSGLVLNSALGLGSALTLGLIFSQPSPSQEFQKDETADSFSRYINHADPDAPILHIQTPGEPSIITIGFSEDAERFANDLVSSKSSRGHKLVKTREGRTVVVSDKTTGEQFKIIPLKQGSRSKSLRTPEFLAELFPNNPNVMFTLSREFEEQKRWAKALQYYRRGCEVSFGKTLRSTKPSPLERRTIGNYHGNSAYYFLQLGDTKSALVELDQAINFKPEEAINFKNRGTLQMKLGNAEAARKDLAEYKRLTAESGKLSINGRTVGDTNSILDMTSSLPAMTEKGHYEEVIRLTNEMIKTDPHFYRPYFFRLLCNISIGNYAPALKDAQILNKLNKTKTTDNILSDVKQLIKEGIPPYGDISILDKKPPVLLIRIDQNRATGISMSNYARTHKGDMRVYDAIAVRLWKAGRIKEADQEIDKALRVESRSECLLKQKVETSEALRNWPATEFFCTRYLEVIANNTDAVMNIDLLQSIFNTRKQARIKQNKVEEAVQDCNVLLKIEPDSAEVYRDRADLLMKLGRYQQAVSDYTSSIKYDDTKIAKNYLLRAAAYDKLGKVELAAKDRSTAKTLEQTLK